MQTREKVSDISSSVKRLYNKKSECKLTRRGERAGELRKKKKESTQIFTFHLARLGTEASKV